MRTIILMFLSVLITLILIPVLLFCYVFRCSQPIIWAGKQALRIAPKILGIRLDIGGVDKIEREKPYIFMSNHLSFLDGPLLFLIIPQSIRVILKKEIFRIPVIGMGMRRVDFVPVDRKSIRGGKQSIDRAARLIREKNYSFLIFPEGTRSLDGHLQSFRRGGFFLALNSQVPIVPISIQGTFELMPKGSFFVRKGTIRVIFHSPVSVEKHDAKSLPDLMSKVRSIIQEGIS
ncbi:MAG: 1-acyl-sn-glycerol-3-phosphate acyltransferase [Candidatus Aminicenantes bacterium]|nr:1-acyl-sn-glycerol-3-phosphate acyltransferase [Candidatus Aminicenantes bacterium]MDH5383148.1 1-acyl-sn-glycerol-3-phosphate acyltransferase [Candidatus Aminicenantes bacterium]MDH5742190.1 1-acyl-sn-glycerol-3-phosphate acyltransferase [Candidatus Aminicenantes bacterium]